ncbi:MAG: pyridoxal phosphate-dependent aminotransferase [Candidatus Schekmanbacteria bacterium]|nr:pyridoxal phosphate-dependent aminotransferase [Candidatus Schekmanbacteria bacterium]
MSLSAKVAGINPSPTLAITAKAKKMKSEGIDIIGFGAGEPDFDTPDHIKAAAIAAINEGFTKYTPSAGILALREAVANKLKRDNGLDYKADEIIISCGAKHSLFNTMLALFEEGDEIILPSPYWVTYPEQIRLAGATAVIVDTKVENGFCLNPKDLQAKITQRTKGIIINSPNNPTGAVYDRKTLEAIAEIAVAKNIRVISDECYEHLVYDNHKHYSIAALGKEIKARTIVINAVSKTYSMTGWRIGYCAGSKDIVSAMENLQSQCTSNPCSIAQKAAVAALNGPQDNLAVWQKEFAERRKIMVDGLNNIPGLVCPSPGGAFYVFPDWSKLRGYRTPAGQVIENSGQMTDYLLDSAGVALVPGGEFGAPDYLRLSYATSRQAIIEGVKRIGEAIAKLKQA